MKNKMKYALVSTFDKTDLDIICKKFKELDIKIISSGSTAKYISGLGYKCTAVSSLTKFKEILDGRIKTLHPKIHASLLYKRSNKEHIKIFKSLSFPIIDYVIVNLYPFQKNDKKNKSTEEYIEMIDIGGPALLRSAAKNYEDVTAICSPKDYGNLVSNLDRGRGETNLNFRKKMAQKVFEETSLYDLNISNWFKNKLIKKGFTTKIKEERLKYGENSNQKANVHFNSNENILQNKIQGKKISYNNILDIDAAMNCISEFSEKACVIIKHNNPCGVAIGKDTIEAFNKALKCDPKSSFGGIVAFNYSIDDKLTKILKKYFFEIIIAKNFTKKSMSEFSDKKNLILIKTKDIKFDRAREIKSVNNGFLTQDKNLVKINIKNIYQVSKKKANQSQIKDIIFAMKVCKHVKSNAIVLVKDLKTIGIGAGQMSRVDSTKIAISKLLDKKNTDNYVAASDAFFPFNDSALLLIKNKCKSIIQPMGSINDKNMIKLSNNKKISLYFTKYRLFKH